MRRTADTTAARMTIRTGISGWRYAPWRGVFYPPALPQRRELEFASSQLTSIEINGSFYALQKPENFVAWAAETPDDFVFSVKGPRFVTHMKKLRRRAGAGRQLLRQRRARARAEARTGPVAAAAEPRVPPGPARRVLRPPAAHHGRRGRSWPTEHDERLDDRAWTTTDADRPLRHVLEVRHASFEDPAFVELLRAHGIGLVVADAAGRWPVIEDVTSDLVYVRLHGETELYASGYDDDALDRWATKIRSVGVRRRTGGRANAVGGPSQPVAERDVFVYFDNDLKVRAPYDSMALAARLGLTPRPVSAERASRPSVRRETVGATSRSRGRPTISRTTGRRRPGVSGP